MASNNNSSPSPLVGGGSRPKPKTPSILIKSSSPSSGPGDVQPLKRNNGGAVLKRSDSSKSLVCSYMHRICLQNRLEGFDYCIRHILYDKNSPFRPCSYTHPQSGKRCPNAARKGERKETTLCPWHIKKMFLKRKQQEIVMQMRALSRIEQGTPSTPKKRTSGTQPSPQQQTQVPSTSRQETLPKLWRNLDHYCSNDALPLSKKRKGDFWTKHDDETTTATDDLRARITEASLCLSNESDEDPLVENTLKTDFDSDCESIDSDQQDPLGHSGVYTAEEVTLILSEKMHRLQNLYIEQFKHLKYLLRERYRKYCLDALLDKDVVVTEVPSKEEESKLQAMKKYHRYHGPEYLLKKRAKERRKALAEGKDYQPVQHSTCIFSKDGQDCHNRSLPATHYCFTHILYDQGQVLFRPCASGTPPCLNPVVSFQHKNACILHRDLKTDQLQAKKIIVSSLCLI